VRCSVVVFRGPEVLLVRRLRNDASDRVPPGAGAEKDRARITVR
jgi:hypothetical protein